MDKPRPSGRESTRRRGRSRRALRWWMLAPWVALAGCVATPATELPQYRVDRAATEASPPPLALVMPGDRTSAVVPDDVKIVPEESVGYADLPATVTALYDVTPRPLTLSDTVEMTLANNRTLTISGYNLRIAEYDVPVNKGIYDLALQAQARYERTEEQTRGGGLTDIDKNSVRNRIGLVGASQLLPSGATIGLAYQVIRNSTLFTDFGDDFSQTTDNDITFQQRATLEARQPLLKGFGSAITNAQIRIAQLERQGSTADFQTTLEETVARVLERYWELVGAIELYKVGVISFSAAQDLLRVNRARYNAGVVPLSDVLQAEAATEERRGALIETRQAVREIEDDLKRAIFLQAERPDWSAQILPTQAFGWREIAVDLDQTIELALRERAELRRARSNIDQNEVQVEVAEDSVRPQVDLVGEVSANGLDKNFEDSRETFETGRYTSYGIGLEFLYPLQNRAARYRLRQAEAAREIAIENLKALEESITLEVRQAERALRTARERIDVTQSQVRSQQENLRAETRRLDAGVSTSFEVLEFQDDLATAQAQHLRAVVDYNIAAIRLERARGTLLTAYGIDVEGAELSPAVEPVGFPVGWD